MSWRDNLRTQRQFEQLQILVNNSGRETELEIARVLIQKVFESLYHFVGNRELIRFEDVVEVYFIYFILLKSLYLTVNQLPNEEEHRLLEPQNGSVEAAWLHVSIRGKYAPHTT